MNLRISLAVLISLMFVLFFNGALLSFFSQDDFYHLRQVMSLKIADIPYVFIPAYSNEQTFYRPLSRELFNFIGFSLFGLNSLIFHLVNAAMVLLIALNVYLLLKKISDNQAVLIIGTVIYLFSSVHSVELYYLPSIQTLLSTLFLLIGLNSYLSNGSGIKKYKPVVFFGLAVLSHESALVFVPIVLLHKLLFNKPKFDIWPLALIAGVKLLLTTVSGLPNQAVYNPDFHIRSIVNTAAWLMLWSFNFSEILPDFMGFFWIQNKNVLSWHSGYFILFSITTIFFFLLFVIFIIKSVKHLKTNKYFLWSFCSYVISLSPFMFFPAHKFSYYLSFTSVWLAISLGLTLGCIWRLSIKWRVLSVITVLLFIFSAKLTTDLNARTHWAAKRAASAKFLLKDIKTKYPNVPKGQVFLIIDDPSYPYISKEWGSSSKQAFFILSGQDAFQLTYGDSTIRVYFEGLGGLPSGEDSKKLITYKPVFPY